MWDEDMPEVKTELVLETVVDTTERLTLAEVGIDQVYLPERSAVRADKLWQKRRHTETGAIEAIHLGTGESKFFSGRDWVHVVGVIKEGAVVAMGDDNAA